MRIAIGLDRLCGLRHDPDIADAAADDGAVLVAELPEQRRRTPETVEQGPPTHDDEVELAVGRIERLTSAELARDQVTTVGDQDHEARDGDLHPVGLDPEPGRPEPG